MPKRFKNICEPDIQKLNVLRKEVGNSILSADWLAWNELWWKSLARCGVGKTRRPLQRVTCHYGIFPLLRRKITAELGKVTVRTLLSITLPLSNAICASYSKIRTSILSSAECCLRLDLNILLPESFPFAGIHLSQCQWRIILLSKLYRIRRAKNSRRSNKSFLLWKCKEPIACVISLNAGSIFRRFSYKFFNLWAEKSLRGKFVTKISYLSLSLIFIRSCR